METRNVALLNILEILKITENRFSGIPTMKRECKEYGLPEPEFREYRGEFIVTFRTDYSHMQASGVQVNKFAKQPYIIFRLWVCFLRLRAPELPNKHPDGHISIWLLPFLRVRKGSHLPFFC